MLPTIKSNSYKKKKTVRLRTESEVPQSLRASADYDGAREHLVRKSRNSDSGEAWRETGGGSRKRAAAKTRGREAGMKTSRTNFSPSWIVNRSRIKRTSRQPEIKTTEEAWAEEVEGLETTAVRRGSSPPTLRPRSSVQPLLALSQLPLRGRLCAPAAGFEFTSRRNLYENLTMHASAPD